MREDSLIGSFIDEGAQLSLLRKKVDEAKHDKQKEAAEREKQREVVAPKVSLILNALMQPR